jgi:hypothetical protein
MYERVKQRLKDGYGSESHRYFSMLMRDPCGVIDSLLLTFDDTHGTVQKRSTKHLYLKYENRVAAEKPELDPSSYGHALVALEEIGLVERDTESKRGRWVLTETDPQELLVVKRVSQESNILQLYQDDR